MGSLINNQKTGTIYKFQWDLGIEKTPSGKDIAVVKVVSSDWKGSIESGHLSKADLINLIQHLKTLVKKMNNENADTIEWPGRW